jgi:hypothetical protein
VSKKPKKAKTPKAPKVKGGKEKVDNITGQWAEEGYFLLDSGIDEDGNEYETGGGYGYFKSDRLPNGRYAFDVSSYNPLDPTKERIILFDDSNGNKIFDSTDKLWGYLSPSKALLEMEKKGLDLPGDSSLDPAGIWEAQISSKPSGKVFEQGFHFFDIEIVNTSVFA